MGGDSGLCGSRVAKCPARRWRPARPRDLRQLGVFQRARRAAIELAQIREHHRVHVQVQAHADGIGGHQRVDLARLEQSHLGVARPRRQRADHHRRPAALGPHPLGQLVDPGRREGHHHRTRRQRAQGQAADIGQRRHSRPPLDDRRSGSSRCDQRAHRGGTQEPGLVRTAGVEQTIGEDVPALPVSGQLDLVHRQEVDRLPERHRFHRADPVARARRYALLFARDQRHRRFAHARRHTIVDLARQKAQRQADHAGRVFEHPLDRAVSLPGVGGTQKRAQRRSEGGREIAWPS